MMSDRWWVIIKCCPVIHLMGLFCTVLVAETLSFTYLRISGVNNPRPPPLHASYVGTVFGGCLCLYPVGAQVLHDVVVQKLPVRFILDRAGLVGNDGPTHHGSFDLTYLGTLPNMVIMAPSDEVELMNMVQVCG